MDTMTRDIDVWHQKLGEKALRAIGIQEHYTVLDFGCGPGNYTIPIAKILGETGTVYALDKDAAVLDQLMAKADKQGLTNITRIHTSGEVNIPLKHHLLDFVILYDIFWYFPLNDSRLPQLLAEVHRILKPQGVLSVYPKHVNEKALSEKIQNCGFYRIQGYSGQLFHYNWLEHGEIINFKKQSQEQD
jgi:ubiquinone/menaquinone biosynthesis C-methylase UbiE